MSLTCRSENQNFEVSRFAFSICPMVPTGLREALQYNRVLRADVLEHTRNPCRVMTRLKRHLAPGGLLIISIPNVAHWSLRIKVLLGRWEYTDRGLLDRTHLHLFTLRSAKAELAAAGHRVRSVAISPMVHRFIRSRTITEGLGRLWPAGFAFKSVIAAEPLSESPPGQRDGCPSSKPFR